LTLRDDHRRFQAARGFAAIRRGIARVLDAIRRGFAGHAEKGRDGMLAGRTLGEFAELLAQGTPTPGGGSAAALAGGLAASLVRMVCDLTIGREKYRDAEEELRGVRERAAGLGRDLLALVDRDAEAYGAVVAARRLPRGTPAEQAARDRALQNAVSFATETPAATAEACAALMELAIVTARRGNRNAASDAGSAALLAYAGVRAAVLNIRVNLQGIVDPGRVARLRDRVRRLEVDAEKRREEALKAVASRLE
jgi:formiminotetrahydrofolate cyclodeaminase